MAQADANEQVKEILRQLIKHRFWIAVGFAALFAVIAYFMGSGPVKAKAATEIANITKAETEVKAYATPAKPTEQYKPIVVEKTEIMGKDVNKAWKELYERQAPLLTWPETVQNRIPKWGPKWPENEDPSTVKVAIVDYVYAYPAYVDMVYKTHDPFDYETGKGIVAGPAKEVLLRPEQFDISGGKVPTLGTVWAAQQRLWVQRTLLEVIREVNKKAKDWDSAVVKEVNLLEVGNPDAQDQRSLAHNEELKKAPDILAPGQQAAADAEAAAGAGGAGGAAGGAAGMMRSMMMKSMGSGGSGGAAKEEDGIYYITPADDKGQYRILPVSMTVLVDQDHVQDLLVELENSPMSIQVMDFELQRPVSRVTKPEKGEQQAGVGMMGMGMRSMMYGGRERGYGGMASQMEAMRSMMGPMSRMGSMGNMGRMSPGMMGMMSGNTVREERKKVSVGDRKKERDSKETELAKKKGPSFVNPYFNIVQVIIYGQARFFNPPPAEPEGTPSPGDASASPASPGAPGATPPAATPAPAGTPAAPGAPAQAAAAGTPEKTATPGAPEKAAAPGAPEKTATATPEKAAAPAPPGTAPSPKAEPGSGGAPDKAAVDKPAEAKPATPPAGSAKAEAPAATPKN